MFPPTTSSAKLHIGRFGLETKPDEKQNCLLLHPLSQLSSLTRIPYFRLYFNLENSYSTNYFCYASHKWALPRYSNPPYGVHSCTEERTTKSTECYYFIADVIALTTFLLNISGITLFLVGFLMIPASASAARIFIWSVIAFFPYLSTPLNTPGKTSALLI